MTKILEQIAAETGAELAYKVPLSGHTSLRLGGTARAMLTCRSTKALVACVGELDAAGLRTLLLAGGSNLVIADGALDLVVARIANTDVAIDRSDHHALVRVEAGAIWDDVVERTVAAGLGGLECLSGIPGSAGATPIQNVGAYGVEVKSLLHRVQLLCRNTGAIHWADPSELELGYRTSNLKCTERAVVLTVEFKLTTDGLSAPLRYRELYERLEASQNARLPAAKVREAVLALRADKGMVLSDDDHDTWSAGSFFTNPVVDDHLLQHIRTIVENMLGESEASSMPAFPDANGTKLSAAWLIERAGFRKGYPGPEAPVRLSTKHTLALTNRGAGTTEELIALARQIRNGVEAVFGLRLQPEPVWVGCKI